MPGRRVLDIGCGVGSTASFLTQRWGVSCFGLDSSAGAIEQARERDRAVTWVLGRAEEIPYPAGYFEAVFCECFLSTVADPVQVLHEVRRVLRPSGSLAVTDLYLRRPEAAFPAIPRSGGTCLLGALGMNATLALFERAGFSVRVWRDRSDTLKSLMASLIFTYGSASAVWSAMLAGDKDLRGSIVAAQPGYYLLVAAPPPRSDGAVD